MFVVFLPERSHGTARSVLCFPGSEGPVLVSCWPRASGRSQQHCWRTCCGEIVLMGNKDSTVCPARARSPSAAAQLLPGDAAWGWELDMAKLSRPAQPCQLQPFLSSRCS